MTITDLIASIKLKGAFPEDGYFSNPEYTSILNDQLKLDIIPLLMKLNEEYFLCSKDFTIAEGNVYRIPSRASGAKLRIVQYVDPSGGVQRLNRLHEEDRGSKRSGYYIKKNTIQLSEDISYGTLRLSYFARPGTLVPLTSCGIITSIDTSLNQVEVLAAPSSFINGAVVDLIQNNNPYDVLAMDAVIQGISGTTITFSELPQDLKVGDYIGLAEQSPVAQVPEELQPVLVQSALCACLSSKKDKAAEFELQKLQMMKESAINLLDPRVESNDNKIRPNGMLGHFRNR